MSRRFTASRVPDSGIEVLFGTEERWQAWLAVESALALTQADLEMIPREAANAIAAACRIERLDLGRDTGRNCTDQSSVDAVDHRAQPSRR